MASIPPPPDQQTQPMAPPDAPAGPGPSARTTVIAILVSVAVIATIGTLVALANSGGEASPSPSAATGVAAANGLIAHETSSRVTLTWTVGQGTPPVRYLISRNGSSATILEGTATKWVDPHVLPETRYSYAVQAVGPDGTKATTHVIAHTKSAPLGTAPLRGVFDVHIHATSHFGFSNFGTENGNLGWRFSPTCKSGPCDTKLTDLHQKDFKLTLDRNVTSYDGNVTVHGLVRCGKAPVASSITVAVRVTDAGVVHGHWVATKIEGTMKQFESQQLGCVASGASFDLQGKVVG